MSYIQNGLIQAADYNGFAATGSPNVNNIWATGSGNSGYGQTALTTVNAGEQVSATQTYNLLQDIVKAANHQGTTIAAFTNPTPAAGNSIIYEPNLASNLALVNTNRLNAALQGSTTSTSATNSVAWTDYLQITFTTTFSSANTARYFFNAGGQIGFQFSHPAGVGASINQVISDICSEFGTVWISSPTSGTATLAGVAYNGVTKIGGVVSSRGVANTNNGFYALNGTTATLYTQQSDYIYYTYASGTFGRVSASYNGAGVLTFTCLFDEVPNGATVSAGTVATLLVRQPSTSVLSNVWGTPTVGSSITRV